MTGPTVLLYRWARGHMEAHPTVVSTIRRREGFMSFGGISEVKKAKELATAVLDRIADAVSVQVGIEATTATLPFVDLDTVPGSTVTVIDYASTPTQATLRAVTVSAEEDGELAVAPELVDVRIDAAERFSRWLASVVQDGSLGGQSLSASPTPPAEEMKEAGRPAGTTFTKDGGGEPVEVTETLDDVSPPWTADVKAEVREIHVTLDGPADADGNATAPTTGPTNIALIMNGEVIDGVSVPAGARTAQKALRNVAVFPDVDWLTVVHTLIGTDVFRYVVQVRLEQL